MGQGGWDSLHAVGRESSSDERDLDTRERRSRYSRLGESEIERRSSVRDALGDPSGNRSNGIVVGRVEDLGSVFGLVDVRRVVGVVDDVRVGVRASDEDGA
jgi:hypothetical protein